MSLTSLLEQKDVKERFRQEFPKPKLIMTHPILAKPLTTRYSTVGAAFDYLLRFYLERINPSSITNEWTARLVLPHIYGEGDARDDYQLIERTEKLLADADKNYRAFLKTGKISDDLIRSTVALAHFDAVFRAGPRVFDAEFAWIKFGEIDDQDVQDLRNLMSLVKPEMFKAERVCLLNPDFNFASKLLRGADTDLVIDDCIIDVKTTKNLQLQQDYFHQLIGYYTLYRIAGITGLDEHHQIASVAIYFSRHAHLLRINVQDVVDEEKFSEFLTWFIDRAKREFKPFSN